MSYLWWIVKFVASWYVMLVWSANRAAAAHLFPLLSANPAEGNAYVWAVIIASGALAALAARVKITVSFS